MEEEEEDVITRPRTTVEKGHRVQSESEPPL